MVSTQNVVTGTVERFRQTNHPTFSLSGNERNQLFLNIDGDHFQTVSPLSGANQSSDGRCFAWLDFDRDGFLDFALTNSNHPRFELMKNRLGDNLPELQNHHMVAIRLVGGNQQARPSTVLSNRDGVGARVWVTTTQERQVREKLAGEGFASQNSSLLYFGLGECDAIQEIKIRWPSGKEQILSDPPVDSLLTIYEVAEQSPTKQALTAEPYHISFPSFTTPEANPKTQFVTEPPPSATLRVSIGMATTCDACARELAHLARLRTLFTDSELEMIAVPLDPQDGEEALASYHTEHQPPYEFSQSPRQETRQAMNEIVKKNFYHLGYPVSIVTNRKNEVLWVTWGAPTVSKLRQLLDQESK